MKGDETMDNNGLWLFALLILFGMGGNGFGYGAAAGRTVATTDDLNFGRLENQVRANENYIQQGFTNIGNGISSLGYELAQQFGRTNADMAKGFCGVDKAIMENRFLTEKAVSDSNASVLAAIYGLSSKMDAEKITSLQAQVTDLKTQQMFCGIPRINPYGYGVYPYTGCCGCNNNNI